MNQKKAFEIYNKSEEANRLRVEYFKAIVRYYGDGEWRPVAELLDDYACWGYGETKGDVVNYLIARTIPDHRISTKHDFHLIRAEKNFVVDDGSTDDDGMPLRIGAEYPSGEVMLVDYSDHGVNCFRIKLSTKGKLRLFEQVAPPLWWSSAEDEELPRLREWGEY